MLLGRAMFVFIGKARDDDKLPPFAVTYCCSAKPHCRMLLAHLIFQAAWRAILTAGNSSPTNTPMMAITTSSSTTVNACRMLRAMWGLPLSTVDREVFCSVRLAAELELP